LAIGVHHPIFDVGVVAVRGERYSHASARHITR